MKPLAVGLTTILCAGALLCRAQVVSLSLVPSAQSISVGGSASVDLVVSGLGSAASPSIGAFSATVTHDPSILAGMSVSFGPYLSLTTPSFQDQDVATSGQIYAFELSFDSPGDLNSGQPDTFTLATFTYQGVASGTSSLEFDLAWTSLSDEDGNSLTFETTPGSITVSPVPEPTEYGTVAALVLVAFSARRRFGQ